MKNFTVIGILVSTLSVSIAHADSTKINGLYVNTFGDSSNPALIFVHGGPGDDSSNFEVTDATELAAAGYFVAVYDERGQGRSTYSSGMAAYNYSTYSDDLMSIISALNLKNPVLLAHSHGGSVAVHFDQKYPGVAKKIVLLDAPTNLWNLFSDMQTNCNRLFNQTGNAKGLAQYTQDMQIVAKDEQGSSIQNLDELNTAVEDVFGLAMTCGQEGGLYYAKDAASTAVSDYTKARQFFIQNVLPVIQTAPADLDPVKGFLANDNYIKVDFSDWVRKNQDHYYGIYGDEDGLFTPGTLSSISDQLGANINPIKFQLIHGASHNVFIDQKELFNEALKKVLKN